MDILFNVMLLTLLLFSGGAIVASFVKQGWEESIFPCLMFVAFLIPALNNYVGNEVIEGTVYAVSKLNANDSVKVEMSTTVKTEIESSRDILKAYEVAIYPAGSKTLKILRNNNNLWRFKFNKREIQLQIEAGKTYKFRIHRKYFGRNILEIQEK